MSSVIERAMALLVYLDAEGDVERGDIIRDMLAEIERLREQNESLRDTLRFIAAGRIRDDCEQGIDRADSFAVGRMARLAREAVTARNQPRREE